jgi:CIC family chloride channel protein
MASCCNDFFPRLKSVYPHSRLSEWLVLVGGSTGAAMAAIVMIFEMTLNYSVIIPLTLAVAASYAVRRSIIRDSVYTRKLTLRGETVPEALRAD